MILFEYLLLGLLLLCATALSFVKSSRRALLLFSVYGLVMGLCWLCLQAPDLAMTEFAVGLGASGILYYTALGRMREGGRDYDEGE